MINLSTISDDVINDEYYRRKGIKEALIKKRIIEDNLRINNDIINRIHAIDQSIPILLYNHTEHSKWSSRRGCDKDPITIPVLEYGYFKKHNLVAKGSISEDEHFQKMAERFVNWIHKRHINVLNDNDLSRMRPLKNEDFYFIKGFRVSLYQKEDYYSLTGGEFGTMGYVLFEYENYDRIIKG
jgi:hypothetical protein